MSEVIKKQRKPNRSKEEIEAAKKAKEERASKRTPEEIELNKQKMANLRARKLEKKKPSEPIDIKKDEKKEENVLVL